MTAQCPKKGYYYRMDNDYPWALDIPSSNNSLNNLWRYPIEGKGVSEAIPTISIGLQHPVII